MPKGIFPAPAPENLITVPSCKSCNNGYSRDEEEFLIDLVLSATALDKNNEANKVLGKVVRELRGERKGVIRSGRRKKSFRVVQSARLVDVFTPSDVFLGQVVAFPANGDAFYRVIDKIVRGLYYHHFGKALSRDALVWQQPVDRSSPDWREEFIKMVAPFKWKKFMIGNGKTFQYLLATGQTDGFDETYWILVFYEGNGHLSLYLCGTRETGMGNADDIPS
ncbi:hypothetical protein [Candidatus Methylacidiphilum infernorum]|uniref:HNH family endonuclease n=1 Tax=Methylacidiphilum infernorum (isolate V4) TaxID=481448 RepID=B3DXH6_METI4|nr:hypothetical protein [Candidatus Methylacidiphilum infernorum]ACD82210.1 HNH family endonuclease [Methylacidiphilum infernorum V4]